MDSLTLWKCVQTATPPPSPPGPCDFQRHFLFTHMNSMLWTALIYFNHTAFVKHGILYKAEKWGVFSIGCPYDYWITSILLLLKHQFSILCGNLDALARLEFAV